MFNEASTRGVVKYTHYTDPRSRPALIICLYLYHCWATALILPEGCLRCKICNKLCNQQWFDKSCSWTLIFFAAEKPFKLHLTQRLWSLNRCCTLCSALLTCHDNLFQMLKHSAVNDYLCQWDPEECPEAPDWWLNTPFELSPAQGLAHVGHEFYVQTGQWVRDYRALCDCKSSDNTKNSLQCRKIKCDHL